MKRSFSLASIAILTCFAQAQGQLRPKITGIDHVVFYTTHPEENRHLYVDVLGLSPSGPFEKGQTQHFLIGRPSLSAQWVAYSPAPDAKSSNRLDHIAFQTEDCKALWSYLAAKGVKVPDALDESDPFRLSFLLHDPEGHRIEFVQARMPSRPVTGVLTSVPAHPDPVSGRLIHAGFLVHDRAAEDHFYKDILGFRLYWHGGMQPDRTDWVAMQVPDGTDWIEYMLNQPANPDLRLSGVMNHISLGVKDMKAAQARLEAHGWKPHGDEHSQMGKDGKWQLNVFDPDLTRVELMEFTPSEKPCCSEFQGPHPHE